MLKNYLYIENTKDKGRGVFTSEDIPADTVVEVAPVIVIPGSERTFLDQTLLYHYIFEWGEHSEDCAMALGYVPIYNHSYQSNCEYFMDFIDQKIMIKTIRKINAGEELTVNYNGDWNDDKKIWFNAE